MRGRWRARGLRRRNGLDGDGVLEGTCVWMYHMCRYHRHIGGWKHGSLCNNIQRELLALGGLGTNKTASSLSISSCYSVDAVDLFVDLLQTFSISLSSCPGKAG